MVLVRFSNVAQDAGKFGALRFREVRDDAVKGLGALPERGF
jgi:hypothetical protein